MTWTGRSDDVACCGEDPGPVRSDETIVRLIHSRIEIPEDAAFTRKELTLPVTFDNTCGEADGGSVDRCDALDDEEICARADEVANLRPERVGRGGMVARVADLRLIEAAADPKKRAVYVYDDPMLTNREHAVIRVSEHIDRAEFEDIRLQILKAFRHRRVEPPTAAED